MRPVHALALAALVAATTLLAPASAPAGVPLPQWSTIDPVLVFCPAGDIAFHVIPRRFTTPEAGAILYVELCNAGGWNLLETDQPAGIFFSGGNRCLPGVVSDATGLATMALKAGGTTAPDAVTLYVDGVTFGTRTLASPDQNGDLVVNAADEAILMAKIGSTDPTGDFDADGAVTESDRTILRAHLGHAAELPVPVAHSTWGRIKSLAR